MQAKGVRQVNVQRWGKRIFDAQGWVVVVEVGNFVCYNVGAMQGDIEV